MNPVVLGGTEREDAALGEDGQPGSARIRDVARVAGVSSMTVSRVLNGYPHVRPATRTRVLAAMNELRFRPNRAARTLATRHSRTIGVLTAATGPHYGVTSSVNAVVDAARKRGYHVVAAHLASASPGPEPAAIGDLLDQDVEGIVIVAPQAAVLSRLGRLLHGIPMVAVGGGERDSGGIPVLSTGADQDQAVRVLMRYLIGQGHTRIIHVAGPQDWFDARRRLAACEAELRAASLPVLQPGIGDWTAESGYVVGRSLICGQAAGGGLGFTAGFCASDQMALGLIHAFREAGLCVPGDVSVAGFDDIPEAAHFWPPLTTVRQDFTRLGEGCVALLLETMGRAGHTKAPQAVLTPAREVIPGGAAPRLVIRNSVRPAAPQA